MLQVIYKAMLLLLIVVLLLLLHGNAQQLGGKDSSQYFLKGNIAVLEGSFNSTARTGEQTVFNEVEMDFPTGFNNTNCVCIAIGINIHSPDVMGYGYEITNPTDIRSWQKNNIYRSVLLGKGNNLNKILLTVETSFTDVKTIRYKIVLLKT